MITIKHLPKGKPLDINLLNLNLKPESLIPHRHEYFVMFWTLEGEGSHHIDFIEYPLSPGLVYCIAPGQVHECHNLPDELYVISFNANFINSDYRSQQGIDQLFRPERRNFPALQLDEVGKEELKSIIAIMSRELHQQDPDSDLLSILLTGFLRYLMRYQPSNEDTPYLSDERMTKLIALIDEHYTSHKDAGFYSDKLALTNKRVSELTRRYLSKTVTQLIHDRIILEARRELAFTNKTVKAIALELGYADTAYFCRFFRRMTSESPSSFRSKW